MVIKICCKKIRLIFTSLFFVIFITHSSFAQHFRFVVWGDSQFENPGTFKKIVKETELLKPAFVIHVGDMIHGYTYDINTAREQWKKFKNQISPLTMPFYPTPGNHDVTTKEIQPAYTEAWGKDKLYYSFDYKKSHFIVLNVFLNQHFDTIPPIELNWLKKDLEKAKNANNIFLSMHAPLYLEKNKYDWKPIQKLLERYNVKAVFSGHYHIYDYRKIGNIKYINLNSSGNMNFKNFFAGHAHGFLFVDVDGKKINYSFITKGGIFPIDTVKAGEAAHSAKFFNTDKSIIISNPSAGPVENEYQVPVTNRTGKIRSYKLTWETNDYRWNFKPWGADFKLKPGETKKVIFQINGPQGNFLRDQLPELQIWSPYKNLAGTVTTSTYYYHLFNPPKVDANYTNAKISVDGKPDEEVWQNQKGIAQLYIDTKNTPAETKTHIKLLYDDDNLYVSVKGEEPNPKKLSAVAYGDIPLVFGDDDFELFFDTNRDQKTFYRLMVNPKGTVLCSSPKGLFSFKFKVKTFMGDNYWSAEFKIPFAQLNVSKPQKGETWGFEVIRHRLQSNPQQSDWSMMQYYLPYQPEYFGLLQFE